MSLSNPRRSEVATMSVAKAADVLAPARRYDLLRLAALAAGACLFAGVLLSMVTTAARAVPSIESFETAAGYQACSELLVYPPPPTVELPVSSTDTDAGAHRDVCAKIKIGGEQVAADFARTLRIDLPAGLIGDPNAVEAKCSPSVLGPNPQSAILRCPGRSQVGTAIVNFTGTSSGTFQGAIYLVESGLTQPARLVVAFQNVVPLVGVTVEARTESDFGIATVTPEVSTSGRVLDLELFLWGVPNANQRGHVPIGGLGALVFGDPLAGSDEYSPVIPPAPPEEQRAFMTNPTVCDEPKLTTLTLTFYQRPFGPHVATSEDPTPTNCHLVPFEPSFDLQPTSRRADDATGLEVDLGLSQTTNPSVLGTSHLRRAEVTLPEGTSFNPSAGDGLAGCTDEQFGLKTRAPARCPDASKIGTVNFEVPLLEGPLQGSVYLGQPLSTDPQSGQMFRLFQVAEGFGLNVKIAGYAKADPVTGRITAVFGDADADDQVDPGEGLPQVPFSNVHMVFTGGSRGVLATPSDCGAKTTTATLTPWAADLGDLRGRDVTIESTFVVSQDGNGAACPATWPFTPSLVAGMLSSRGGEHSTFSFTLSRQDREQRLSGLTADLPAGLLAKVKDVPLCTNEQANANACPESSRVGTVTAGAGAGAPLFLPGKAYLTEAYKGAAYGLSVAVPAVAGPFDLGVVVVRQAVHVDPVSAQVKVVSDPLPTIWHGIPLRLRTVGVDVDRPTFTLNATSCQPKQVKAAVTSTSGARADLASHYQATGCRDLRFRPRMALRLRGRKQTRPNGHPGLQAVVTQPAGQANIGAVKVVLPLSLALDPDNAQALCEFEDGLRVQCPPGSIIGRAKAESPLLNRPLEGPVYFVKNVRIDSKTGRKIRTLPSLLIPLRGEIAVDLRGTSSVRRGKLVNTFAAVPDASVSRFELSLEGGKRGIIVVTGKRSVCRGVQVADVEMAGHNGRRRDASVRVKTPCRAKRLSQPRRNN